jgi:hypothetical protein
MQGSKLIKHIILWLAFGAFTAAQAQDGVVRYAESKEDFPNPERGFYIPMGTSASHFSPLNTAGLKALFAGPRKYGKAHYAVCSTLLMRDNDVNNDWDSLGCIGNILSL